MKGRQKVVCILTLSQKFYCTLTPNATELELRNAVGDFIFMARLVDLKLEVHSGQDSYVGIQENIVTNGHISHHGLVIIIVLPCSCRIITFLFHHIQRYQ